MIEQSINLSDKAEELLAILQRDIEHIEWTIVKLNELRGFVIKRNEKGLTALLEEIQTEAQTYSVNEQNRCKIREQIAIEAGCRPESLTLTILEDSIEEPLKSALTQIQKKIKTAAFELNKEYILTVALLKDCSRINSLLLKTIFEGGRGNLVCYNSAGTTSRQQDASFMSMRL
jgi:hypothetical protein